jgi:hypothetical protein
LPSAQGRALFQLTQERWGWVACMLFVDIDMHIYDVPGLILLSLRPVLLLGC